MNRVKDENLRLIYAKEERDYILAKRRYHALSMFYCALCMMGFGMASWFYPDLVRVFADNIIPLPLLMGLLLLMAIGGAVLFFPAGFLWLKYYRFLVEHQKFMEKYHKGKTL